MIVLNIKFIDSLLSLCLEGGFVFVFLVVRIQYQVSTLSKLHLQSIFFLLLSLSSDGN